MPNYEISTPKGKFKITTSQELSTEQLHAQIKEKGGVEYLVKNSTPLAPPAPSATPEQIIDETTGGFTRSVPKPDIMTKSLTKPPTQDLSLGPTLKQLATGVTAPIRGFRGLGVGAATGDIQRAAEAVKPGFEPESTRETVGAVGGAVIGSVPLYAAAAAVVGTGALATGATLAGLSAIEQFEETGKVSPGETAIAGTIGLILPGAGKVIAKVGRKALNVANTGLKQVANTTLNPNIALMRNIVELDMLAGKKIAARAAAKQIAPVFPGVAEKVREGVQKPIEDTLVEAAFKASNGDVAAQGSMLKKLGQLLKKTPSDRGALVKDLIIKRSGELQVGLLESQRFIRTINKELTQQERNALPFLIEGKVPQVALDTLPNKQVTPAMNKWSGKVREYLDEAHKYMSENMDDAAYLENYIPHMWDLGQQSKKTGMSANSYFTTRNPFLQKRKIPTLLDGMEQGYTPKTTDISQIISMYDNVKVRTVANRRLVDGLKNVTDEFGNKLVQRLDKAPAGWVTISHPSLSRAILGKDVLGNQALKKIPVAVHPEIEGPLKVVLDNPWNNKGVRALEVIKGVVKKAELAFSFFHPVALEESLYGAVGAKKAAEINAKILKSFAKGELPAFADFELTKDASRHGLILGAMPEFYVNQIQRAFKGAERLANKIPLVGKAAGTVVKGGAKFNDLWDRGLWDYTHTGFKLNAYREILVKNMADMKATMSPTQIKRVTAQQVNDLFGGQNWDALMVHPKVRQLLNMIFLAPDWNISALRQFGQPFQRGVKGKQGRRFWMRAALYMQLHSNVVNYANTKRTLGKGHFMWDNDPGSRTRIFIGKDDDGRNEYIRQGKQFREAFELLDPNTFFKTIGNKLAPTTREVIEQLSGTSVGGFPLEFSQAPTLGQEFIGRGVNIAGKFKPFALSETNFALAFPKSRGMTPFKLFTESRKAFELGDTEAIKELAQTAKNNGISNARNIINAAKRRVELKKRKKKIKALKKKRKKRRK